MITFKLGEDAANELHDVTNLIGFANSLVACVDGPVEVSRQELSAFLDCCHRRLQAATGELKQEAGTNRGASPGVTAQRTGEK